MYVRGNYKRLQHDNNENAVNDISVYTRIKTDTMRKIKNPTVYFLYAVAPLKYSNVQHVSARASRVRCSTENIGRDRRR